MRANSISICTLLLIAVLVVFLAPSIDLAPTALRASRAAKMVLIALAAAALTLGPLFPVAAFSVSPESKDSYHTAIDDLVTLNCTRLC